MGKFKSHKIHDILLEMAGGDMAFLEAAIAEVMKDSDSTKIDLEALIKKLKKMDDNVSLKKAS